MKAAVLLLCFAPALAWAAEGGELDHLNALGKDVQLCWSPPAWTFDSPPRDATLRFALRADGTLMGEPQVVYSHEGLSAEAKQDYIASIRRAVVRCAPFKLSKAFGDAMAGRPITIRFHIP